MLSYVIMVRLPYLILLWVLKDHAGCKSDVSVIRLTKDYVFLRKLMRSNGTASLPAQPLVRCAVVRALRFPDPASHGWVCCWFSSLLRGFFSGFSGSPPPQKSTLLNSNSIWKQGLQCDLYYNYIVVPLCRFVRRTVVKRYNERNAGSLKEKNVQDAEWVLAFMTLTG